MHLRQFGSQLSIRLMRSSWIFKMSITCILCLIITIFWWFGVQRNLRILKNNTVLQITQLLERKKIFDEVLLQYQALNQKMKTVHSQNEPVIDQINYCKTIVDQAGLANLSLQSYTTKKLKNGHKQMIFTLSGDYQELLTFLHYLNQVNLDAGCNKLRVAASGYRLQIAYVCGIHTSVK
jgi:hypothetical protein